MSRERRLNTINSSNLIGSTLNEELNYMLRHQKTRNVNTKLVKIKEQLKQSLQNLVQNPTQIKRQLSKSFEGKQKIKETPTEQKPLVKLQKSFIDLRQHINEMSPEPSIDEDKLLLEKLKTLTMEQQEQNLTLREENAFLKIQLTKALQENQQLQNILECQKNDKVSKSQQTLYEKILEQSNMNKLPRKISNHKVNQSYVISRQDEQNKKYIKSENIY